MEQEEKEIYSLIFKLSVKLLKDRSKLNFAQDMLKQVKDASKNADESAYSVAWDMLKEYADITNKPEETRWQKCVDDANRYGMQGYFKKVVTGCVLSELERRATRTNDE